MILGRGVRSRGNGLLTLFWLTFLSVLTWAAPVAAAEPAPGFTQADGEEVMPEPDERFEAKAEDGALLYRRLSALARKGGSEAAIFGQLHQGVRLVTWDKASARTFTGNLRRLEVKGEREPFYLLRATSGELFVLKVPTDAAAIAKGAVGPYANLAEKVASKMSFKVEVTSLVVEGRRYNVARLTAAPERQFLDRLFYIAIVLLLFLTMVGMGLTLTVADFALVFRRPAGMIIGPVCQFGLLPLMAMLIGRAAGYHDTYPFIFLGLILISASPGGVTSNLMTYFGKGDVALSVSLTAVCTVLALGLTPLLLSLYGSNVPDFSIPVMEVFTQILVLVIVPLAVGMVVRWRLVRLAKRLEKPFAMIGLLALLFLVVVGILGNLEKFGDTARYGPKFYGIVFLLTFAGMFVSGLLARLARVKNFQIRAIALECGLRNASLAMTIALLLQDRIGDFYSSMFFTAGIFGLWMYVAGFLTIWSFKLWLPVKPGEGSEAAASSSSLH